MKKINIQSFSLLEMIMAILIIGILASMVLPKFGQSKKNAQITKVKSDIASIRMGIILNKNKRMLKGESGFVDVLDKAKEKVANEALFNNDVLIYPIYSVDYDENKKEFSWSKIDKLNYRLWIDYKSDELRYVDFKYDVKNGTFDCDKENVYCRKLTQ